MLTVITHRGRYRIAHAATGKIAWRRRGRRRKPIDFGGWPLTRQGQRDAGATARLLNTNLIERSGCQSCLEKLNMKHPAKLRT